MHLSAQVIRAEFIFEGEVHKGGLKVNAYLDQFGLPNEKCQ